MNWKLLREWIRAEIAYDRESCHVDEDGCRSSALFEGDEADRLFDKVCNWEA